MKETEITVQVFNSIESIQRILSEKHFEMIENYQLNDWYFSKLDDVKDVPYLELMNSSFLIRQIIADKEKIQLCYKKKELDACGNVIAEEKTTCRVDSLQNALDIMLATGLNNYCVVKNDSYVYSKENICFVVQIIEDLGIFIEYEEDETMQHMTSNEKFDYMSRVVNSLGLSIGEDYSCKKVYMLLHK